jgi:hypothetical protein
MLHRCRNAVINGDPAVTANNSVVGGTGNKGFSAKYGSDPDKNRAVI